jgi:ATP-dependent DNA helicase RecQ
VKSVLKKYFGYDEFRDQQEEIISSILNKQDTLVLMPTGGGKSLCFQIPALILPGVTLVVSPLISLMKDQVDALTLNGIEAEYLNSTLSEEQVQDIYLRLQANQIKLLYITPERLALKGFREFIQTLTVSLVAIDEAHCISEWGHDFREDYRKVNAIKSFLPDIPIIALTATATSKVRDDIVKQLKFKNPRIFQSSFDRENLKLLVREKKNYFPKLVSIIDKNRDESIIIYCHSRKETKEISDALNSYGFKSLPYHAGLSDKIREKNQDLFIQDKVQIIVATIAFGMGIDKSNVRVVIHTTFSKSLEGYYQEIGRAGRDGLNSECILFFGEEDVKKHEYFIGMISNTQNRINSNLKLQEMIKFSKSPLCRRVHLLKYFGETYSKEQCNNCDVCLEESKINTQTLKELETLNKKFDKELFQELKTLRKNLAEELSIIPSHIFGDVTLRDCATQYPKTEEEFMKIPGVSQEKLLQFGDDFLMHINEYIEIKSIEKSLHKPKLELSDDEEPVKKVYKKKYKKTYKKKAYKKKK